MMQLRLLRVLETMEFERVGESKPTKVDVRIIAATNQNLKEKILRKELRLDLYYRLNVVEISLPPLRERLADIPFLVDHFISKFNRKFSKKITGITTSCMKILTSYHWPGNVRELENALEHCFIRCSDRVITGSHLPVLLLRDDEINRPAVSLDESEIQIIRQALHDSHWNKSRAAAKLGMSRRTIYRKMQKYNMPQN
jgi:transcriptional regulator with PAS, ATPase and Fis domain